MYIQTKSPGQTYSTIQPTFSLHAGYCVVCWVLRCILGRWVLCCMLAALLHPGYRFAYWVLLCMLVPALHAGYCLASWMLCCMPVLVDMGHVGRCLSLVATRMNLETTLPL